MSATPTTIPTTAECPAATSPDPKRPTSGQILGQRTVTIVRSKRDGVRLADVREPGRESYLVPVELLPLAHGKDLWMRKILVLCAGCRKPVEAGEMESGELCPACFEAAGEENARLDGITEGQG